LDDTVEVEAQVEADSWVEAKRKFGFDLSIEQELLLEKRLPRKRVA
jgi:hypothetical protein